MTQTSTTLAAEMQCVSIGYYRDDGDLRILATLNNHDEEFTKADFPWLVAALDSFLQNKLRDDHGEFPTLEVLNRQDAPDYVTLEDL